MKNLKFLIMIIVLGICVFFVNQEYAENIRSIPPNVWQIWVLFGMFVGILYAEEQISELRKEANYKRLIAVTSLITEMKYNQNLLKDYIQHCEEGAHVTPKGGRISWEWNKPCLVAFEKNLILACGEDFELARELTSLYDKLESCKAIIETVHHLAANNLIEQRYNPNVKEGFQVVVSQFHKQLCDISKEAQDLIDLLLKKLELKKDNL